MKTRDFDSVKLARKAAIAQLEYYNTMMATKTANEESVSQQYIAQEVEKDMQPFYEAFDKGRKMGKKKLFVVETISTFRNTYVIEADELEHAYDEVTMIDSGNEDDSFEYVTQRYLGETISSGRQIKRKDFDAMLEDLEHDKNENCSHWMGERLIRKIDYDR
jgi:hypothetical protein